MPSPPPGAPDGVGGVAPHATIISIRQSSRAFEPERPGGGDMEARKKAGTVATLASAIVHAANMGAKRSMSALPRAYRRMTRWTRAPLEPAVWYATVKDAVIVAAAGNEGETSAPRILPSTRWTPPIRATGTKSKRSRRRPGSRITCCRSVRSITPELPSRRAWRDPG